MSRFRLTVSSGTGPREVRVFVRLLSDALVGELAQADAALDHSVVHGASDAPASMALSFHGDRQVASNLVGTHALIMSSEHRGKRDRKRWYAGVSLDAVVDQPYATLDLRDVEVETCRAGGAGGQHVNRTESAVRVTHRPSGISVRVESERSQHQNKARALETLGQALLRERALLEAQEKSARRLRALHVERGRPVAVWRVKGELLIRQ